MEHKKTSLVLGAATLTATLLMMSCGGSSNDDTTPPTTAIQHFNRIASFPVCQQLDISCDIDTETATEIVAASEDGLTLIYTDSPENQIGFVDITDISTPRASGLLALGGEPTSVAIKDNFALVGVNTSTDFINVSGLLSVVDVTTQTIVTSIDIGGQPDSIAVSPDGHYAAVVIENERDEDLGDGEPPQAPAGSLVIVNLAGTPTTWTAITVDITGLATLFPGDPEPEYVDINENNIAVVTLQENNHIILINMDTAQVVTDFSAGTVDLDQIDMTEEEPASINLSESQTDIPREPDGVAWIDNTYFATADEGDLNGGSRGFTIFDRNGNIVFSSGNELDHRAVRLGHYPDNRSGNKGNEPENVEVGIFDGTPYLFVNSERSNLVFVYDVSDPTQPVFKQTLPTGAGPEGGLAIPARDLLVVASEVDDRSDKIRSVLNLYQLSEADASYPTLSSIDRTDGTPIPWSAMSGLAVDANNTDRLFAIEDSFYGSNRIFGIDISAMPASLDSEITITDSNNIFAAINTVTLVNDSVDDDDVTRVNIFDNADLAALINDDKSVNIDPEGIAQASDGGFWVASEGSGTIGDDNRPINSLNFIIKTDTNGVIENVITLPSSINNTQVRFGFEGIAEFNSSVYVTFQRAWGTDLNPRIGIYNTITGLWSFLFYPLDTVESQNGGWVGLSDITSLGNGNFLVIERDNQGGPDAAIKRLYRFNINGLVNGNTVSKTLVRDLVVAGDLSAPGGLIYEKIEGLAVTATNEVYIINDNDGVDDNSGETQLINLGNILN